MNGSQLKTALAAAGMSQSELSRQLKVSINTVNRWASAGVPDNRALEVQALLQSLAPKLKTVEEQRVFRTWDGSTEMSCKQARALSDGAKFWEYAHPGHPVDQPWYRTAFPCWIEQRRLVVRGKPNSFVSWLQGDRLWLPADATPAMFAAVVKATSEEAQRAAARLAAAFAAHPETDPATYPQEQDQ